MSHARPRTRLLGTALAAGLAALAVTAGAAETERSWTGPGGASTQVQHTHSPGEHSRSATRTGPNGASVDRSTERSYDAETGIYDSSRSVTYTGPEGQSVTRSREAERGNGAASVERAVTGPQGQTYQYERSHGGGQAQVTRTLPDGRTGGWSRAVTAGSNGAVVERSRYGVNGRSAEGRRPLRRR